MTEVSKVTNEMVDKAIAVVLSHDRFRVNVVAMRAALEAVSSIHEAGPVAWKVEHVGGETNWNLESNARQNAKTTGGVITPLFSHPAPMSKGVTVKALEWEDCDDLGLCADTVIGRYWMEPDEHSVSSWQLRLITIKNEEEAQFTLARGQVSASATQAFAQADFDARIRSCLSHTAGEIEAGGEDANTPFNVFVTNALHEQEVDALKKRIAELEATLKPFDIASSALFTRNFNNSDVVVALPVDASHPQQLRLTAKDFFAVRTALSTRSEASSQPGGGE